MNRYRDRTLLRVGCWRGTEGSTLVEVMVSCVVLMVIAIAGAEYLARGKSMLVQQKNKRVAIEVANSRLEDVRGTAYRDLVMSVNTNVFSPQSVVKSNSTWVTGSGEMISVSGASLPISTVFQFTNIDGAAMLRVTVGVQSRADLADRVTLQTLRGP